MTIEPGSHGVDPHVGESRINSSVGRESRVRARMGRPDRSPKAADPAKSWVASMEEWAFQNGALPNDQLQHAQTLNPELTKRLFAMHQEAVVGDPKATHETFSYAVEKGDPEALSRAGVLVGAGYVPDNNQFAALQKLGKPGHDVILKFNEVLQAGRAAEGFTVYPAGR